jgi:isopenicillin-N epimerase
MVDDQGLSWSRCLLLETLALNNSNFFWGSRLNDQRRGGIPRSEWKLDPNFTFLNHGSYGATPRAVIAEQDRWRERMEQHPTGFMTYELPTALREAAAHLATFVGCNGMDLAFVENATVGCNAVLNSLSFSAGDEILVTDHGYAAVRHAAEHVARKTGARIVEAKVAFPTTGSQPIVDAVASQLGPRTRIAILDHITSPTAVIFPIGELASLCHSAGASVLIDGAHGPGMLSLDISSIGADWYVGNCHKWLMAAKGSAFLWTDPKWQREIHPLAISHGYGLGYTAEFDWIGTRDPSAWLSVPAAIDFHMRMGGPSLRARNIKLACASATWLAHLWKTERGSPDDLTGSMATVRLPLSGAATIERAIELRAWLFEAHRIELAIMPFAGSLWARISAQGYNEPADYQRLLEVFQI